MRVKLEDVCKRIYAGGDVPKDRYSEVMTEEYSVPIYANAEKDNGLYGYTDKAREEELSITVAARGTIGFTAIRREPFLPVVRLITVVPDTDKVSERYLYYVLKNCKPKSSGTSIPQLTVPDIKKNSLELYDISEQEHIADQLDNVNRIIEARKQELQLLDDLIKARFVELFGDVQHEEKYKGIQLRELCTTVSGGTPSTKFPDYYEGDIPWISTVSLGPNHIDGSTAKGYITQEAIDNSATKLIPAGNILFGTRVGVGKSSLNDVDICTNQDIVAIIGIDESRFKRLFIKHVLDAYQPYYDSIKKGATILGITGDDLKDTLIPDAPIEIQMEYEAFVEQVDKSKVVAQQAY